MLSKAVFLALVPAVLAVDHPVTVGENGGLTFTPNQILAYIGDTITFTFVSKNHTVTTTNFSGAVCPPPAGGVGVNGWDSGFLPVVGTTMPQFVYTVVDTAPHFAACMQGGGSHCRAGMTFALNPTEDMTFDEFNANAEAS
ncbi:hypothetical protein MVEN_02131000 [Mycena venus]|uniref:Extracellular serine-rich protein n=1 Tax=Mycena venus TaxID=2733690 RepID=A0A8H6XAF4_9AGAR|nr:hypothetical protein MVEN_02131000 [Mycena venus]